ncbi:MAG: T9SS type A sorting domain-containing protein [Candidatus Cloacimonetes bacterium]|nr:T9SS type A sorting domain-containing protein [Candidatus Cloacimonadota bacterium]
MGKLILFKLLILVILLLLPQAAAAGWRDPASPDWQVVNYCNSTTAYGIVTIDGISAQEDDIVAAFIDGECRGAQNINSSQGQSYVTIVINGESIEFVEFYFYQAATGLICNIGYTTWTSPGGSIGYPPEFLPLAATSTGANHLPYLELPEVILATEPVEFLWIWSEDIYDPDDDLLFLDISVPEDMELTAALPDWQAVSYSSTTQLFAEISINDEPAVAGDVVAAFVNDECRGVAAVQMWGTVPFVALSVYGTMIEPVSFHIYSTTMNMTWLSDFYVNSSPGNMIGYPELLAVDGNSLILESDLLLSIENPPDEVETLNLSIADTPPVSCISAHITIMNSAVNNPPLIELPLVSFLEDNDFEIDLLNYITDPDNDPITVFIENQSSLTALLCGSILTITPPPDWSGSASLNVIATDDARFYAIDTLFIQVIPVNDPPQACFPAQINIDEDSSAVIDMADYIIDIDDDSLEVIINSMPFIEVLPAPPQWQPVQYNNWATGYITVTLSEGSVSDGSILAAFSGNECRGVSNITVFQNQAFAIIMIYCSGITPIKFRLYENDTQTAYNTQAPVNVTPNSNLGFPPEYYHIDFTHEYMREVYCFQPLANWFGEDNLQIIIRDPSQAEVEANINIQVLNVPDPPTIAFPEPLRFVSCTLDWLALEDYIFDPDFQEVEISLAANPQINAIIMNNNLYIIPLPESIGMQELLFIAEDVDGFITEQSVSLEILEPYCGEIELVSGWNWISCGWGSNHYQAEYILNSIGNSADYLKGQYNFLYYDDLIGWYGSMQQLDPKQLYKTHLQENAQLSWTGWNISDSLISVVNGWNWIGYTGTNSANINLALAPLNGFADYIKHRDGFAQFYPDIGWIGSLQNLHPGHGYIIHSNTSMQLTFPQSRGTALEKEPEIAFKKAASFEFTASITAVIPEYEPQPGDQLLAFSGDQVCGMADFSSASIIDLRNELGNFYYFLSLYTNQLNPQPVHLQLYQANSNSYLDLAQQYVWEPDTVLGNLQNPEILTFLPSETKEESDWVDIKLFPNPLLLSRAEFLKIELPTGRVTANLAIYNLKGQKIKSLTPSENNLFRWDLHNRNNEQVAAGIYFLRISDSNSTSFKKILLLK